ncbi:MAG TPA: tetratricopeptide repeat protein [Chthoniobacterales bacterium]|nr:tetratricopeptide repeat protein [Chthoniobacterales bacterium]
MPRSDAMNPKNFFGELKRRNVYKVAITYAVVAWLLVQAASILLPTFEAPTWVMKAFVVFLALGFVISVMISWAFEATPEGLKRTENVPPDAVLPTWSPRKFATFIVAVAVIAAGLLAYQFLRTKTTPRQSEAATRSIAVLPFVNMSADKNDEYLSDGVSEELITALSKITGLQVKARTSSFAFKGKNEDIQKIGELLHVSHLLEGSVAKAGNKLRITAQLIQASDGNHEWSDTYDREMQDIFAVRSEVAQQVADTLKVRLLGEDKRKIEKKPTENLEAYNLYRQGRFYADKLSEEGMTKAVPLFQQAIEKDPRFALAYAGMADNYVIAADAIIPPREAFSKAKEAALKAIELDDSLAEAHASLGFVHYHYDWDWAGAEKELKRALELNPQSAQSYTLYTHFLAGMGRYDEAKKYGAHALELDPLSVSAHWFLGWGAIYAGRNDEAIGFFSKALELDPNNPWTRWFLGRAYLFSGNSPRAIEEMETGLHFGPDDPLGLGFVGYAYAVTGRRADALKILQRLDELQKRRFISTISRVYVYAGLGDKDKAFEWLEKAYQERSDSLAWFRFDPESKSLRSDPRFAILMRKIGFTEP